MTLAIKNLNVSIEGKKIIKGLDLTIKPGEIHALMGPNGSGKSTFAHALMGHSKLKVKSSKLKIDKKNISNLGPDERAKLGLFLAFQYPHEVPGLSISNFLRHALNSVTGNSIDISKFRADLLEKSKLLGLSKDFSGRSLNEGFSGGEKKKAEILQMAVLKPKYAILDETDSGLDIDSLKQIAKASKKIARNENIGVLVITHYQRILKYLKPDFVHILIDGKIVKSGGPALAENLEEHGYNFINNNDSKSKD